MKVLRKEDHVLGGYKKEEYRAVRIWAESWDGAQVFPNPITLSRASSMSSCPPCCSPKVLFAAQAGHCM